MVVRTDQNQEMWSPWANIDLNPLVYKLSRNEIHSHCLLKTQHLLYRGRFSRILRVQHVKWSWKCQRCQTVKTLKIGLRDIVSKSSTCWTKLKNVKECQSVGQDQICRTGSKEVEISDKDGSIRQIWMKSECWIKSGMSDGVKQSQNVEQSQRIG
jgi:hypothetical protein